jgi:hypothetical protein
MDPLKAQRERERELGRQIEEFEQRENYKGEMRDCF